MHLILHEYMTTHTDALLQPLSSSADNLSLTSSVLVDDFFVFLEYGQIILSITDRQNRQGKDYEF